MKILFEESQKGACLAQRCQTYSFFERPIEFQGYPMFQMWSELVTGQVQRVFWGPMRPCIASLAIRMTLQHLGRHSKIFRKTGSDVLQDLITSFWESGKQCTASPTLKTPPRSAVPFTFVGWSGPRTPDLRPQTTWQKRTSDHSAGAMNWMWHPVFAEFDTPCRTLQLKTFSKRNPQLTSAMGSFNCSCL